MITNWSKMFLGPLYSVSNNFVACNLDLLPFPEDEKVTSWLPWQGGVIDQDTFQKFLLLWINWCGRGLAWKIGGAQKIVHAASFPGRTLNLVGLLGNPSSRDPWDSVSRGFCPARATFGQRQRPIWPKFGLRPLPLAGSSSCSSVGPLLLLLWPTDLVGGPKFLSGRNPSPVTCLLFGQSVRLKD